MKTIRRHSGLDTAFSIENITLSRIAVPKFKAIPRPMLSLLYVGNASSVFPTYLHIMFIYEKPDKKQRSRGITYSLKPFRGLKLTCSKIHLPQSRVQKNLQGSVPYKKLHSKVRLPPTTSLPNINNHRNLYYLRANWDQCFFLFVLICFLVNNSSKKKKKKVSKRQHDA